MLENRPLKEVRKDVSIRELQKTQKILGISPDKPWTPVLPDIIKEASVDLHFKFWEVYIYVYHKAEGSPPLHKYNDSSKNPLLIISNFWITTCLLIMEQ